MTYSHQNNRDVARLKSETQSADKRVRDRVTSAEGRLDEAEAFEAYVRDDLYPWLAAFAVAMAYPAPPEPPA